jgi:hypothetical protein
MHGFFLIDWLISVMEIEPRSSHIARQAFYHFNHTLAFKKISCFWNRILLTFQVLDLNLRSSCLCLTSWDYRHVPSYLVAWLVSNSSLLLWLCWIDFREKNGSAYTCIVDFSLILGKFMLGSKFILYNEIDKGLHKNPRKIL